MKKHVFLIIALACLTPLFIVSAFVKTGDNIEQKEPVYGTSFFAGSKVVIDADIDGDLFVFGENVTVNGMVSGDIIGAAQRLVVNKDVGGNLRFAAKEIEVNNKIERSVTVAGQNIDIKNTSYIGRNVSIAAETVKLDGSVAGDVDVAASRLEVGGKMAKDVNYYSEERTASELIISSQAVINGDVNYNAFGEVQGASIGTNVLGSVNVKTPEIKKETYNVFADLGFLLSLVLVLFVIIFIGGKNVKGIKELMFSNIGKMTGFGAILFFMLPIVSIILMITGFGFFLGIVGLILWLLIIPFSILFSIISFGESIMKKVKRDMAEKIYCTALIGAVVTFLIAKIPFIGFLMIVFFIWWGSGAILFKFIESRKENSVEKREEIKSI